MDDKYLKKLENLVDNLTGNLKYRNMVELQKMLDEIKKAKPKNELPNQLQ